MSLNCRSHDCFDNSSAIVFSHNCRCTTAYGLSGDVIICVFDYSCSSYPQRHIARNSTTDVNCIPPEQFDVQVGTLVILGLS